jgi:hypothetical protein
MNLMRKWSSCKILSPLCHMNFSIWTPLYETDRIQGEFNVKQLADGSYFVEHPRPKETYTKLPSPIVSARSKEYPRREITKEEIIGIQKLRLEQPDYWTQTRLSDKFKVPRICIAMYAPCSSERKERLSVERHQKLLNMGYKKKLSWLYKRRTPYIPGYLSYVS